MKVKKIMSKKVYTVSPETSIGEVSKLFDKIPFWSIYVTVSKKPVGVITRNDLKFRGANLHPSEPSKKIMSEYVYTIDAGADISEAKAKLTNLNISGLAVTENEFLCGIITNYDLRGLTIPKIVTSSHEPNATFRVPTSNQSANLFYLFLVLFIIVALLFVELNLFSKQSGGVILNELDPVTQQILTFVPNIVLPNITTPTAVSSVDQTEVELGVHNAINTIRVENNLNELVWNPQLSQIARIHSKDMALRGYFNYAGQGHIDPEGHDFVWRMAQSGFKCNIVESHGTITTTWNGAENLHFMKGVNMRYSYDDIIVGSDGPVQGWMQSSSHQAQILEPRWKTEGIGVYILNSGNNQEIYFTQLFC